MLERALEVDPVRGSDGDGLAGGRVPERDRLPRACLPATPYVALEIHDPDLLCALQDQGDALANADAHGAERVTSVGACELARGRGGEPRAARAERMPERDRAAVRVDVRRIVGDTELRSTASACEAKASLSSMTSIRSMPRPKRSSNLRDAGAGPMPMMRGSTPRRRRRRRAPSASANTDALRVRSRAAARRRHH